MAHRSLYLSAKSRGEVLWVAAVSICAYGFLFSVSTYFLVKLVLKRMYSVQSNATSFSSQMDDSRKLFFAIISFSAFADIPLYFGCISNNGPADCEWDGDVYKACWILHLFAVAGYASALGIPLYLWSEVVNGRDGKIWNSRFPSDFTRKYLYGATALYVSIQMMIIVMVAAFYNTESKDYDEVAELKSVVTIAESICITFISAGWCWCGIRLQLRVRRMQFRPRAERKISFIVTIIMSVITLSFFTRAIFVLSLMQENDNGYHVPTFYLWVLGTRWLPHVICSFMLIYVMRRSEGRGGANTTPLIGSGSLKSRPSKDNDTNVIASALSSKSCSESSVISFVSHDQQEDIFYNPDMDIVYEELSDAGSRSRDGFD